MLTSSTASVIAFISTNIDDLLILTLLYAQTQLPLQTRRITVGHSLGIGLLALISLIGAFGTRLLPVRYVSYLGIIPVLLGIRALWEHHNAAPEDPSAAEPSSPGIGAVQAAAITIANGADNIGVYIPLFAGFATSQLLIAFVVFFLMNLLWCKLGQQIASLPMIRALLSRYKNLAMGIVFIAIGMYILIK